MEAVKPTTDSKGKGKARERDPPTRALLRRFYPLVLPLPAYLSALLPHGVSTDTDDRQDDKAGPGSPPLRPQPRPWWLLDGDDAVAFGTLKRLGIDGEPTAEETASIVQALRGIVVCVSCPKEAARLSAIRDAERGTGSHSAPQGHDDQGARQVPSKGKWQTWTNPNNSDASQYGAEDIVELIRHSQQIIFRRNAALKGSARFAPQDVLTMGYRSADVRSDALKFTSVGRPSTSLTNFYVNTVVTKVTMGMQWRALLDSVGANVFVHLLTATSLYEGVSQSDDCLLQVCGRPLPDMTEQPPQTPAKVTFKAPRAVHGGLEMRKKRKRRPRHSHRSKQPLMIEAPGDAIDAVADGEVCQRVSVANPVAEAPGGAIIKSEPRPATTRTLRLPSGIAFVRNRIFYARPIKARRSQVVVGLPLTHPIIRSSEPKNLAKMTALSPSQENRLVLSTRALVTKMARPLKVTSRKQLDRRVRHILKYIFPRAHKLHNVFTSVVDRTQTTQAFPDYTMRDVEIRARGACRTPRRLLPVRGLVKTMLRRIDAFQFKRALDRCCPSRLPHGKPNQSERAEMAADLSEIDPGNIATQVQRTIHASQAATGRRQNAFSQLPRTQGAVPSTQTFNWTTSTSLSSTQKVKADEDKSARARPRFYKYAVSPGQVKHFVYVVLKSIVPQGLLGSRHNMNVVLKRAMEFACQRRYESLTLHEAMQGIRISEVDWLLPINPRAQQQRATAAENQLRQQLFNELVYWLFDSLLIPLLKTTFYITESAAFRNRVLYFRQDDWAMASAPLLDNLKKTTFTPLSQREALLIMSNRNLGYSHIRLLPKEAGVRPIVNLRRRSVKQIRPSDELNSTTKAGSNDKLALDRSINNILQSTFHILTYERRNQPDLMSASVFGLNDIYQRLKTFKSAVSRLYPGKKLPQLYFVKVDVQAAFDTIEQGKLLNIVQRVLTADQYMIQRFSEIMPAGGKIKRKFSKRACPEGEHITFPELAQELANSLRHVVFIDGVVYGYEERQRAQTLLEQHIQGNLVKIGRDFFKQRVGIPQGSSLSSLLCSMFYADMERSNPNLAPIGQVHAHDEAKSRKGSHPGLSLLMRYTDDFLFISTSRRRATSFFKTMLKGHPDYGCFISPAKTLANFDLTFPDGGFVARVRHQGVKRRRDGQPVTAPVPGQLAAAEPDSQSKVTRIGAQLPWCGILLNTATLAVSSDLSRYHDLHIADTLTVETGRKAGTTLTNKFLQSIQSRSHLILIDASLNGTMGVHVNIYHTCLVAALKLLVYARRIGVDPVSQCDWLIDKLKLGASFQYTTIAARIKSALRAPASTTDSGTASSSTLGAGVHCTLQQTHVKWLALHAFRRVLSTRPAQWHLVVRKVDEEIAASRPTSGRGTGQLASRSKGAILQQHQRARLSLRPRRLQQARDKEKKQDMVSDSDHGGGEGRGGGGGGGRSRRASTFPTSRAARVLALLAVPQRAMAMGGAELLASVHY